MSDEPRNFYCNQSSFSFQQNFMHTQHSMEGLEDHLPRMSFSECLNGSVDLNSLAKAFCLSPPSEALSHGIKAEQKLEVRNFGGGGTPITPNSSVSSSSTELGGNKDSGKCKKGQQVPESEDGRENPKKEVNKSSKKGEKKQREARFAFMTRSEVDHLDDGYRWRKYGQKAVKNTPFPRSYYRCTTEKCRVKKRVERSCQDPSVVVTTYEGQHSHPIPGTLQGSFARMLPPPCAAAPMSFPCQPVEPVNNYGAMMNSFFSTTSSTTITPLHQQLLLPHDFGIFQDMVPHINLKREP
ncbi:hypothetical protein NMG60_11015094 [Bertholletia excelsa]